MGDMRFFLGEVSFAFNKQRYECFLTIMGYEFYIPIRRTLVKIPKLTQTIGPLCKKSSDMLPGGEIEKPIC